MGDDVTLFTVRIKSGKNFDPTLLYLELEARFAGEVKTLGPYYGPTPIIDEVLTWRVPNLQDLEVRLVLFLLCIPHLPD